MDKNSNSGRKWLSKALTIILVIVLAVAFDIDISDWDIVKEILNPTEKIEEVVVTPTPEVTITPMPTRKPSQSVKGDRQEGELVVHMIDVGQADCFLLIQDNETTLVDCGTRSTGKDAVEYIKSLGITKLDYVIGTHPHDDHMGGMYDIITNFEIGTIIIPIVEDGEVTANWYLKLMNELNTGKYQVQNVKAGDGFNLGDATIEVLAAETGVSNTNNYSIVLKVSFGEMDIIMTGDAETEIEELILESGKDIDAEIYKAGHHGSDTSNSKAFLDAISPDYALISCKVGNKYEHPIKSVMEDFEARGIEVYRTDENGSVVMTVTANAVTFDCEPGDYLSGIELEEREG